MFSLSTVLLSPTNGFGAKEKRKKKYDRVNNSPRLRLCFTRAFSVTADVTVLSEGVNNISPNGDQWEGGC